MRDVAEAQAAWQHFERLCANEMQLMPVEPVTFHRAAVLALDPDSGLRAGDALHLAAALDAKAKGMATLDEVPAKNAKATKLKPAVRWFPQLPRIFIHSPPGTSSRFGPLRA